VNECEEVSLVESSTIDSDASYS